MSKDTALENLVNILLSRQIDDIILVPVDEERDVAGKIIKNVFQWYRQTVIIPALKLIM